MSRFDYATGRLYQIDLQTYTDQINRTGGIADRLDQVVSAYRE